MTTNQDRAAQLLYNEGCGSGDTAHYIARRLADAGLLTPDLQPRTLADTEWDDNVHPYMEAVTVSGRRHILLAPMGDTSVSGNTILVADHDGGIPVLVPADGLFPTGRYARLSLPEEQATEETPEVEEGIYGHALWGMFKKAIRDEKEYHIDAQDYEGVKRWRDAERALSTAMETNPPKETPVPNGPEDVKPDPQPGEAWLIEYEGKRYEAVYWYSPLYAHWSFVVNREGLYTVESPEATPVSRLVPENGGVS